MASATRNELLYPAHTVQIADLLQTQRGTQEESQTTHRAIPMGTISGQTGAGLGGGERVAHPPHADLSSGDHPGLIRRFEGRAAAQGASRPRCEFVLTWLQEERR